MPYYPDEFKEYLKSKADIVAVISQFVPLKKMGRDYVACCPFHEEKNPSFHVRTDKQTFGCYACGAGSRNHSTVQSCDVYGFLKGILRCNLGEAIEWLANFLGEPLPVLDPEAKRKQDLRAKWIEYCERAAERFQQNLMNNKEALAYLYQRGFTMQDILLWKLGFGDDVDYDFRNTKDRIVFTLFDFHGNIISFTGRTMLPPNVLAEANKKLQAEGKMPIVKYLDRISIKPDDPYYKDHPYPEFDKGNHLFGMHIAKEFIRQWGEAVIVEGWTDVIKLHKYGVQNAVCTMGTALTEAQTKLLVRAGAKRVVSMRDGDEAGMKAIERDAKMLTSHGIQTFIIPMPEGLDPCDLCDNFEDEPDQLLRWMEKHRRTISQWRLERIHRETYDQIFYHQSEIAQLQQERMRKVIEVLSQVEDPVELDIYIRQASELFEVSYESIKARVDTYKHNQRHLIAG
ncbi:DNA primase [Alicyclobacillus shizuokensis]|uniref:DNA primase n=1 Tax=Alicyclobacillus shizuokensis TaxID=392014 RepID=UPI000837A32F|nr:CHC2 zinc finger domain-containing protein [Alicyclobacillus shizuokensis]